MPDELPLDLPPPQKRKRRRHPKRSIRHVPRQPTQMAMFQAPDVVKCGFCGATVTVLAEVATCPECGGIVSRPERDDADR